MLHPNSTPDNIALPTPENQASVWVFAVLDRNDVNLRRLMLNLIPNASELIKEAKKGGNGRLKLLVACARYFEYE